MDEKPYFKRFPQANLQLRKIDTRIKKFQRSRSTNFLFFGFVLGMICSYYHKYSVRQKFPNLLQNSLQDVGEIIVQTESVDDSSINQAEFLYEKVKVLCAIFISARAVEQRGDLFLDTWGKRCHSVIFFAEKTPNITLTHQVEIVVLKEYNKFAKYREAMKYLYDFHINDFDWLLKTDDKAFIVMENLRHLLYQYDSEWPIAIGQIMFNQTSNEEYMLSNYVFSKRTFKTVVEEAFKDSNSEKCEKKAVDPDIAMSKCFDSVNIIKVDTYDKDGKAQFFRHNPELALFPLKTEEYDTEYKYKLKQGLENCCSDKLIAINNHWGMHMYYFEYFIYKVHAFGRHRLPEPMPAKMSLDEVIARYK